MRAAEMQDLSDVELDEHIKTARREQFGLRFQHATRRAGQHLPPSSGQARDRAGADGGPTT